MVRGAAKVRSKEKLPPEMRQGLNQGLLKRLPVTFRLFFNQELREWEGLFPFECRYLTEILSYLGSLKETDFDALFQGVRTLEEKMEVGRWQLSTREQTLEEASLLARSPYYLEWRKEVQRVFDEIERGARHKAGNPSKRNRLILLIIPANLPFDPTTAWKHWKGVGEPLTLDLSGLAGSGFLETLMGPNNPQKSGAFLRGLPHTPGWEADEIWALEGVPGGLTPLWSEWGGTKSQHPQAVLLSFPRLELFRNNLLGQLNSIRKDLVDADNMLAHLREIDVTPWCPPEMAQQPVVQEFVRSVFLSGNGALLFGSAFVEWAASEGFRRARPAVLVAYYGIRNKPKPFTSVAIFENQNKASPLPDVEELAGSALDAQVMMYYTWLAAIRYPEYQQAACLCLAVDRPQAYWVVPPDFPISDRAAPVKIEHLASALADWLAVTA
jgi:hypothetical protein